jgi:hypothetical protein
MLSMVKDVHGESDEAIVSEINQFSFMESLDQILQSALIFSCSRGNSWILPRRIDLRKPSEIVSPKNVFDVSIAHSSLRQ